MTTARPSWLSDNYPSYGELVESMGYTILATETFGSYQGDLAWIFLDENGRAGWLMQGYGSCSGCDHLESISYSVGADYDTGEGDWSVIIGFRDEMREAIHWEPSQSALAAWLATAMEQPDGNHWWSYDDEVKRWGLKWAEANLDESAAIAAVQESIRALAD